MVSHHKLSLPRILSFFVKLAVFLIGAVSLCAKVTVTTVNGGEETITSTPDYTDKSVTTTSTKGWTRTTTVNNLGLPTGSSLSGTGIPTTGFDPIWRADGSLASVELTIAGESTNATFNPDGTLASLVVPHKGEILGSHTIADGSETLTADGVTVVRKLDGTQVATSGTDIIGKTDTLAVSGDGYRETIHPTVGSDTSTDFGAAGAPTGKNYAAGPTTSYGYEDELPKTVTVARGGALEFGYSQDSAKDLTSVAWPGVSSGPFTIPPVTQSYGYDRAGRVEAIGDASGARNVVYQNGRPWQTTWSSGLLAGYAVVKNYDSGRETGFTLYRGGTPIHSVTRVPNGLSDEVLQVTSGGITVVPGRDQASQITGFQWWLATNTGAPSLTQTWERGSAGRIVTAGSDVTGAPSFNYRGTANNEAAALDANGRRLKCATAGGEWTYQYTAGQLTSAIHTTLGTFTYHFDRIGRRTDMGAANASDVLNRTLAWTNSQNKTLKITADPTARVWVGINGGGDSEISNFTGSADFTITTTDPNGGWVPWHTLAVLEGRGEGTFGANTFYTPLANPDAKAERSGAVWVPPVSESFAVDADGNRQSTALWDFGWDGRNKLVRARTKNYKNSTTPQGYDITCDYDTEGRRFKKNIDVYQYGILVSQNRITFVWDGWDLIYERHQLPSGLTTLERKYVWGPDISGSHDGAGGAGGLLLIRETRGTKTADYYPLCDGSGHVVALATMIEGIATLVAEYAYGPFGELIYAKGPMAQINPIRYASKYYDVETGLYYWGLRYYDPITAQWTSRELLGEDESLDLYSYCHNDPVNNVDVLGLAEVAVNSNHSLSDFGLALVELAKSDPKAARSLLLAGQVVSEVSGAGLKKLIGNGSDAAKKATSSAITQAVGRAFGDGRDEWLKVGSAAGLGAEANWWSAELPTKNSVATNVLDMISPSLVEAREKSVEQTAHREPPSHYTAGEIALEASYIPARFVVGVFNALALPRVTTGQEVVFKGWTSRPGLNEVPKSSRYSEAALMVLPMLRVEGVAAKEIGGIAAEEGQIIFRGVPGNGTQKALQGLQGIATPRGTALDEASLYLHVLGEDVNAGVTSWTLDRNIARTFAGADGTIIEVDLDTVFDQIVPRPPVPKYGSEKEILLKGTVQGRPTKP